jgi:hypothetical protein
LVFLSLVALLPGTADFAKAIFLSSFATMIALNASGLHFVTNLDDYHAIVLLGLNAIITTPMMVSLFRLRHSESTTITGYAICYLIYMIIAAVSYTFYFGDAWGGCAIIQNMSGVLLVVITLCQILFSALFPLGFLYNSIRHLDPAVHRAEKRSLIVTFYGIAIIGITCTELLRGNVDLTGDTEMVFSFGQIFAVAMTIAPTFEVIKYLLAYVKNIYKPTNTVPGRIYKFSYYRPRPNRVP